MRNLDATFLVYDGPIARAYLALLRHRGIEPQRIVLMVSGRRRSTGKIVARWLPNALRQEIAERYQETESNYWSRQIAKTYPELYDAIVRICAEAFGVPAGLYEAILAPARYDGMAPRVDRVLVDDGLSDPGLVDALRQDSAQAVVFTGGGIVPASLLNGTGRKFIHVHPGFLPPVRGADGLLWSILTRGRPGASCFYLAPGLDVGDIILAREYNPILFPSVGRNIDDLTLYRAIFAFVDPIIRAVTLVDAVRGNSDPASLPARVQQGPSETYNFMHDELRSVVLRRLFA